MPIDSSIYLQQETPDFLGGAERAMRMRDMVAKRREDEGVKKAFAAGVVTNEDGTQSIDQKRTLGELMRVSPERAQAYDAEMVERDAAKQKMQYDKSLREADLISRAAGSVRDQGSYEQALGELGKQGVDVSQMPRAYDPNLVNRYRMMALSTKEQLENQLRSREVAVKEKELDRKANGVPRGYKYEADPVTGETRLVPAGKQLPAETASKIGNLLGAAQASSGLETMAGEEQPTGKLQSAADWFYELTGQQGTKRSKFLADVGNQRNEVMSRIAGANVVQDEKDRIQEGIPTRTDAPDAFKGKAISTTDGIIRKAQAEITALEDAGYDVGPMKEKLERFKIQVANNRVNSTKKSTDVARVSNPLLPSANAESSRRPLKGHEIEWAD